MYSEFRTHRYPDCLEIRNRVMTACTTNLSVVPADHIIVARATIQNIVIASPIQGVIPALHTVDHCYFRNSNGHYRFRPTGVLT